MPRKPNPDLIRAWKTNLPATLAGKIEHLLFDPVHNRARYGVRGFLIERLLEHWLGKLENTGETAALQKSVQAFLDDNITRDELRAALLQDLMCRPLPTLEEVRDARS